MVKITDEMREAMEDAIASNSSGGTIDKKKVGMLFRACGLNPTEAQMADWKKECGGGDVDVEKFKSLATKKLQESGDSQDEIIDAFSVFDKDGTGFIPATEFKHICCAMGEALSEKEIAEVLRDIDIGSDGMINYRVLAEQIYNL
mmetsp:Transcript_67970/g.196924  ORF Transcript_67970/g.196924 Transcript_67970/m.196924 type:complete len:145 (+) Transcript_67970:146-580(+)